MESPVVHALPRVRESVHHDHPEQGLWHLPEQTGDADLALGEKPPACAAPLRPSASPCAATVCSANTFCPARGPNAIRQVMRWPISSSSDPAGTGSPLNQPYSASRSIRLRFCSSRPMRSASCCTNACSSAVAGERTARNTGAPAARAPPVKSAV
jgi:hypothetical protein